MAKPVIAVFSGPRATVTNSPPLVTSNKARLPGETMLPGTFDHLVGQTLHEPVVVRIRKFIKFTKCETPRFAFFREI